MREKRRRKRQRRIFLGSMFGTLAVLAVAYCGVAIYFNSHFFFRTKVNGWKIGGMDMEAAEEKLDKSVEEYLLTIYDRDGEKHHIWVQICARWLPGEIIGRAEALAMDCRGFPLQGS